MINSLLENSFNPSPLLQLDTNGVFVGDHSLCRERNYHFMTVCVCVCNGGIGLQSVPVAIYTWE